ncbi:MAG: Beta-glucosidase, partial [Firmicutes bacterium]|nr:Beta-glucosidase [Bacillota bacterium]
QFGEIGITHVFNPAFSIDNNAENEKATYHANQYSTAWYYDPILLGTYPEYVVKQLAEKGWTPEWTAEELDILKVAAPQNDFIGLNYYQPQRVAKNDVQKDSTPKSREQSTGAPGNASFDGVYKTVKMADKVYTKWGWEISAEGFLEGLRMLKAAYGDVKMYITENGLGDEDLIIQDEIVDVPRIKYIKKQYGFIYVDHTNNLARKKKLSFHWYKQMIATRGEEL